MDWDKRKRLSEILKTLHDLSESIDGKRHSKPLLDALRGADLRDDNELFTLIEQMRTGLMRVRECQAELEKLGYQQVVRAN